MKHTKFEILLEKAEINLPFLDFHNFSTQKKVGLSGFICPILENHDEPRSVSLYLKPHQQNSNGAKALATAFMFLRGLPFIFQGQELGMTNTHFDSLDEFKDLLSHDEYKKCLAGHIGLQGIFSSLYVIWSKKLL